MNSSPCYLVLACGDFHRKAVVFLQLNRRVAIAQSRTLFEAAWEQVRVVLAVLAISAPIATAAAQIPAFAETAKPKPQPPHGHSPHLVGRAAGIVAGVSGADGFVLTNDAAVPATSNCVTVRVARVGVSALGQHATVVARDKPSGLVLLRVPQISYLSTTTAAFRTGAGIRPGETVIGVGLPRMGGVHKIDGVAGTVGVEALPGDSGYLLRVTTSGPALNEPGPLLDLAGNTVGMIIDKRAAMTVLRLKRKVPFSENFAVGVRTIRAFLDAKSIRYRMAGPGTVMTAAKLAKVAYEYTVSVTCWD